MLSGNRLKVLFVALAAILFAWFPLTDTDIWWHLACAREWVVTWTAMRTPAVNVHEFFQQVVAFVYGVDGAPLLVAFKALLWGTVFVLFLGRVKIQWLSAVLCAALLFVFRYQFEIRPVLFSLFFLGVYWNVLPWLFKNENRIDLKRILASIAVILLQWVWCKTQGLYVLGPLFALGTMIVVLWKSGFCRKTLRFNGPVVAVMFLMPFAHGEGLRLLLYPFGLLDRLMGISSSAVIFAKEIAENRSPITLLMTGEDLAVSLLMILLTVGGMAYAIIGLVRNGKKAASEEILQNIYLVVTGLLTLAAERNFVLFLPMFVTALSGLSLSRILLSQKMQEVASLRYVVSFACGILVAFVLGVWAKTLGNYDASMISYQRVPVAAAEWMKSHPHKGRLFNDDRAGGYLAFVNPSDFTYIDGRFILKTADFFERYLNYATSPELFLKDAMTQNVDRVVLPVRYYARWNSLISELYRQDSADCISLGCWTLSYRDEFFVVFDRK